jgi:hypothetical protein
LSLQKRRGRSLLSSFAGCPAFWRLPQTRRIVFPSVCFTSNFLKSAYVPVEKGGLGFSPDAFGYPNAMLALPGTVWDKKKDDTLLGIVFPWLRTHFIYRFNSL